MRVHWRIRSIDDPRPRVVTLGSFDGVHRGHQEIIRRAVRRAHELGGTALAITFHPHPVSVVSPDRAPSLLGGLRLRMQQLGELGLDTVVAQHFTRRFSQVTAEEFVREHLARRLQVRHVIVGYNVGFGHKRGGNAELLRTMGRELGYDVEVVEAVRVGDNVVSSSAIRRAVAAGELDLAAEMLGRPYRVTGHVRAGFRRGRTIGFPTANIRLRGIQLPPDGVYAVRADVPGRTALPAVANLGFNPTFEGTERSLETHVFDLDADLYGRRMDVEFVARIRPEMKFPGIDALREQISRDAETARRMLSASLRPS